MRASYTKHVANGLCSAGCGRPLKTKVYCAECAEKLKKAVRRWQERISANGLCLKGCGRLLFTKLYCWECLAKKRHSVRSNFEKWSQAIAASQRRNGRLGITKKVIKDIWERQQGCCAITGEELTFGSGEASLDHIKSVADGGTDNASNLRIIHCSINRAKNRFTDAEFAELILKLVPWATKVQTEEQERANNDNNDDELDDTEESSS